MLQYSVGPRQNIRLNIYFFIKSKSSLISCGLFLGARPFNQYIYNKGHMNFDKKLYPHQAFKYTLAKISSVSPYHFIEIRTIPIIDSPQNNLQILLFWIDEWQIPEGQWTEFFGALKVIIEIRKDNKYLLVSNELILLVWGF